MRELFPKSDRRLVGLIVAVVLLFGSIPFDTGAIVTMSSGHTELSADICHQPQSLDLVSNTLLARPAIAVPAFVLPLFGWVAAPVAVRPVDYRVAPDTPPPKQLL
jgi:hypothetical protein